MSSNDKHPPESYQNSTPRNITNIDNENISNFTFSLLSNKNKVLSPTNNINTSPVEFEQRSTVPDTFIQKEIEPEITTTTGILSTGAKLDLGDVALKCENTYYNSKGVLQVFILERYSPCDIWLGVTHEDVFGFCTCKYYEVDSSPKYRQLISELKTILKEASKLNDCDTDMDKIRELKRKYTDTFNVLGEAVVGDYYAQVQDKK